MDNEKIKRISELLLKDGSEEEIKALNPSDDEIEAAGRLVKEEQPVEDTQTTAPVSAMGAYLGDTFEDIEAVGLGFAEKASMDWLDEAYGAMKAMLSDPNDKRPWADRYREAQQEFQRMSDTMFALHPKSYTVGGAAGLLTAGAGLGSVVS